MNHQITNMLTQNDRKYIETAMDAYFDKAIGHHTALQNEFIKDQIALVIEVAKDKPGKEEVRDIAREEARAELRYHGLHR